MIQPNPDLAVLYSELVLSLYPILIKTVNTNIFTQVLARFLVFPALALAFGSSTNFSSIWSNPYESFVAILNNLLNLGHIATSYISFKNLPVGTAIALFYLYPIFNIIAGALLFGESLSLFSVLLIAVAFFGTYLISSSHQEENITQTEKRKRKYGIIMAIVAAFTETMIFIFVKSNTDAQISPYYTINHLYPAGLAILLGYAIFNTNIVDISKLNWAKLLGFNAFLGFTGYVLRFYAIPKISTLTFSLLSFFGVAFGYIWGILFTKDKPTMKGLLGGGLIAGATSLLRYFS
jgi:drug/metabolite transporter (DMT)-like permease